MKKLLLFPYVALLFLAGCVSTPTLESQFQAVIDSVYAANPQSVGIMAHIESPGNKISWSGASGFSDKEAQTALEADQPALIASNIKTYVSAAILKLAEAKKLSVEDPVQNLLTKKTRGLFKDGGYDLEAIKIKHLLSHTSGIQNFANMDYVEFIDQNKTYRWTRDEQLELTIKTGPPLGEPGTVFNYSDANYLLLTEIMEDITGKPFYTSMRELLNYEKLGLNHTWFPTLEEMPDATKPLVHQYWGAYNWDSYDIDISIDLYGGGGIAATTADLARFNYSLFNGEIITDTAVFNLIYTEIKTENPSIAGYRLGLWPYEVDGTQGYGHSGFWGTIAIYFPDLHSSMAIYILEKNAQDIRNGMLERFVEIIKESE